MLRLTEETLLSASRGLGLCSRREERATRPHFTRRNGSVRGNGAPENRRSRPAPCGSGGRAVLELVEQERAHGLPVPIEPDVET
ncbi:MAG: hypothetical protein JWR01_2253 [Subtercola sp.]|nr:hypothetical protein [Subtercola sp.]